MPGYKVGIGQCELISLTDAELNFPWSVIFPHVPEDQRESYRDLYPSSYGSIGFRTDAGAYVVRSGGKSVMVDTGIGPGPHAMLGGLQGRLVDDMKSKGIAPEEIDAVVHTHLHFDHVGWNLADGKPTFPNATYCAPKADLEFFEPNAQANPQLGQILPLREMGRLELFEGSLTIAPGISTIPTPGHTPGHSSVLVESDGAKAIVAGDVAHHPMQVDHPEWSGAFDVDGELSAKSRKALIDRLENEGIIAAFCHFPGEGLGKIVRDGGRRVFQVL